MKTVSVLFFLGWVTASGWGQPRQRAWAHGIQIGLFPTGALNAIADVRGVRVGHTTLIREEHFRTGVTAVLPHAGNWFGQKVPAAES